MLFKGGEDMQKSKHLVLLWTCSDREVAEKMVFMYTLNGKLRDWWSEITLIIWGPSAKLLVEDEDLSAYILKIKEAGVQVIACKACADSYHVTEKLENLGIDVKYMGEALTVYLQEGYQVLSV